MDGRAVASRADCLIGLGPEFVECLSTAFAGHALQQGRPPVPTS
jgi:hypothetical protein